MDKKPFPVTQVRIRTSIVTKVKVAAAQHDQSITDWLTEAVEAKLAAEQAENIRRQQVRVG